MSTFTAFFVGCLVGAIVGIMSLALVVVARDAEEREQRMNRKVNDYGKED